jgi:hypothetical protein
LRRALDHNVFDLAEYIIGHLLHFKLQSHHAARLLELDAQLSSTSSLLSSSSIPEPPPEEPHRQFYSNFEADTHTRNVFIAKLRDLSLSVFQTVPFRPDIFKPLTRNGLILVLQACRFDVMEIEVIRAVHTWVLESPWVVSTYGGTGMHIDHLHALTLLVDPTCLTAEEFASVDSLFLLDTQVR